MADSVAPLAVYLDQRERELVHQIAALKGQLEPAERELADIRKIKASQEFASATFAHGLQLSEDMPPRPLDNSSWDAANMTAIRAGVERRNSNAHLSGSFTPVGMLSGLFAEVTIKELIIRALHDHFHQGAKPSDLRDFFKNAYGRDIPVTSISPQLTRLREEGTVEQVKGITNTDMWWTLTQSGRLIGMGHWPMGARMKEGE